MTLWNWLAFLDLYVAEKVPDQSRLTPIAPLIYQQILGPGLPGISGFGFKRLQDFSAEGLGDIQLGAKYQYLRTQDARLAATGGVRVPTGRQDDPDDLADVAWRTVRRSDWETPSL